MLLNKHVMDVLESKNLDRITEEASTLKKGHPMWKSKGSAATSLM